MLGSECCGGRERGREREGRRERERKRERERERERETDRQIDRETLLFTQSAGHPPHPPRKPRREQLLHRNVQRFRGGLVFKTHRLSVSLNSRLESNEEEEEEIRTGS